MLHTFDKVVAASPNPPNPPDPPDTPQDWCHTSPSTDYRVWPNLSLPTGGSRVMIWTDCGVKTIRYVANRDDPSGSQIELMPRPINYQLSELTTPTYDYESFIGYATTISGNGAPLQNAIYYENPTTPQITSITPNQGLIYGGEEVTITGTNLDNFKWLQVSAGTSHTCAIGLDSKAYCWGRNSSGQLGDSSNAPSAYPTKTSAPAGISFNQITTGHAHTCALTQSGNAYCWGFNSHGQIGNGLSGTLENSESASTNTPVAVVMPTGVTFSQIAAGANHTCAIGSNNRAYSGDQTAVVNSALATPLNKTFLWR